MNSVPLVTIGVVSYNRLLYLRALMESARECINYPNIQWIVVDGNSVEPGLREYVESLDFVQHKVFIDCTHAEAMSRIVDMAKAEFIMILPEDVQFILKGNWLQDMIEVVSTRSDVGHIVFDAQRRVTVQRLFGQRCIQIMGHRYFVPYTRRRYEIHQTPSGREFLGCGNTRVPIAPAGIVSFGRTALWRQLGPWGTSAAQGTVANDSSLGAEDYMLNRYSKSGLSLKAVMMRYPVCADILTDPRGTKARIRGGKRRYGRYMPPFGGNIYYRIWDDLEVQALSSTGAALAFEEIVRPIGYDLPLDSAGNLLKVSVIRDDEPYELITPDACCTKAGAI